MTEMAHPSPPRPTIHGARSPPVIAPGIPVKSGHLGSLQSQHHSRAAVNRLGTASPPAFPSPPRKRSSQSNIQRYTEQQNVQYKSTKSGATEQQNVQHKSTKSGAAALGATSAVIPSQHSPSGSFQSTVASTHGHSNASSTEESLQSPTAVGEMTRGGRSVRSNESGTSTLSVDGWKSPREPDLVTPKEQYTPQVMIQQDLESQFDHLLDSLQVPSSVRQKFSAVSQDVKSSILTSTLSSNPAILASLGLVPQSQPQPPVVKTPKSKKRMSAPGLRKTKSSSSLALDSPGADPQVGKTYAVNGDAFVIVASPNSTQPPPAPLRKGSTDAVSTTRPVGAAHVRHHTAPRPLSLSLFGPSSSTTSVNSYGKSSGKGLGIAMAEQPESFVQWMKSYKGTDLNMDIGRCKKLRMLLRHESTGWVETFIHLGGYDLLLARLQDLLDVEWREEQHDDQMLYEILRCIKALGTSEIGKSAMRSSFPRPFPALSALLFSEKKPGDIASRQIIIELWLFLYDLYPDYEMVNGRPGPMRFDRSSSSAGPSSLPSPSAPPPAYSASGFGSSAASKGGGPRRVDVTATMRSLLLPEQEDKRKDQHEFITQAHRPRVFRAWMQELSDICRDYFWIMCHGTNTLWALEEVDERLVERPVAPGGATGGVEFEAVNYVTTHFRLLNAFCSQLALEDPQKATGLHGELLQSGLDRILVTMRKASTTYYPTLHLELARYVAHLRAASPTGRLPHLIERMVGSPPEELRRRRSIAEWHSHAGYAAQASARANAAAPPRGTQSAHGHGGGGGGGQRPAPGPPGAVPGGAYVHAR